MGIGCSCFGRGDDEEEGDPLLIPRPFPSYDTPQGSPTEEGETEGENRRPPPGMSPDILLPLLPYPELEEVNAVFRLCRRKYKEYYQRQCDFHRIALSFQQACDSTANRYSWEHCLRVLGDRCENVRITAGHKNGYLELLFDEEEARRRGREPRRRRPGAATTLQLLHRYNAVAREAKEIRDTGVCEAQLLNNLCQEEKDTRDFITKSGLPSFNISQALEITQGNWKKMRDLPTYIQYLVGLMTAEVQKIMELTEKRILKTSEL